ncbi:MAG: Pterin deaminase [Paracidovorax wautersii]|uniref:Pterin deaminase n=1 Tax=Paracidovorax wautersii TaxID=1177982 RepID=A0A7V8FRR1_9BURK|nr:MAG: Pterin deaminase [Paracidovorax wautersii]
MQGTKIASLDVHHTPSRASAGTHDWHLAGALALPCFVDAHTHLDKAYTLPRMGAVRPGLLGAIEALSADRATWTAEDIRARATRGLRAAWRAGTRRLRTHVDWDGPQAPPLAWHVLAEMAQAWRGHLDVDQVSLIKLPGFDSREQADALARQVALTGPRAVLGAFVHSSNWRESALRHLLLAAQRWNLDVDLHVDEELDPRACGLATAARIVREIGFANRLVCGHACALAAQDEDTALRTLDAVSGLPITLVALPATNLLLQDAATGRTPRQRGLTLVHEARARGIPVLLASDNVQDPFCRLGSFDPLDTMAVGTLAGHLDSPFDRWSDSLCRGDWLERTAAAPPTLVGQPADLVVFSQADAWSWPAGGTSRTVLRGGRRQALETPA